jgi:hypothetical protein
MSVEKSFFWTQYHVSVGFKVAAYFQNESASGLKLFTGKVVKFLPATDQFRYDQLYHILWDDGDEEDYELEDLVKGMDLHDENFGWLTRHKSVRKECAAYIQTTNSMGRPACCLSKGVVVKYKPERGAIGCLYRVKFERDGVVKDFNESEFQIAVSIFNRLF